MTDTASGAFSDAATTWNRRFEGDGFLFGTEPNVWLSEHIDVWPTGGRILCVADGEGRNSVWLARKGFIVDAFDIAEAGVAKAYRLAARAGVTVNFTVADCDEYPWQLSAYDGVAAIFVQFAAPEQRRRLFNRIAASLKPGGALILQGYTPKQLEYGTGGPPFLSHLYTAELLRAALDGLDVLELSEYEADVNEGSGQKGRSALIGMVARRGQKLT
jgi:SAM-dependent methyltransferase